ncbi:GAP family protein [Nonomuraea sp. NPDC050786]|uniref:GAP family protein n=1 Tax=Nonomuraea sp. NPDC050786 TaxID=3154840 RepID=UPI0033E89DA6
MDLAILPLAITMVMGPQIMSAIVLATTERPVRVSLTFLAGVAVAATAGVAIAWTVFALLAGKVELGRPSEPGSLGTILQIGFVALLALLAIRNYVPGRPPSRRHGWPRSCQPDRARPSRPGCW